MSKIIKIKNNGIESYFGAITDGNFKIEFNLYDIKETLEIAIGIKIQLCGDLEKTSLFNR